MRLSVTVVQAATLEQQLAACRADRPWEASMEMPEGLSQPIEAFIHYLLEEVGDEFEARVADADSPGSTLTSTAEGNLSHIRSLKDLHYLWKHYHESCGALRRIASLKYKTSYAGEYAEAECVGERGTRLVRVTFSKYDRRIDGCWLTDFPAPPTYPPVVYDRLEWTPDDEMLIDFERVSDATRRALSAITE